MRVDAVVFRPETKGRRLTKEVILTIIYRRRLKRRYPVASAFKIHFNK